MPKKKHGEPLRKQPKGVLSMEPRAVVFDDGSRHKAPPAGERWWMAELHSPEIDRLKAAMPVGRMAIFFVAPVDSDPDALAADLSGEVKSASGYVTVTAVPIIGWYTQDHEYVANG